MFSRRRPFTDVASATLAALAICAAIVGLSSSLPAARAAGTSQLQQRITSGQGHISSLQGTVRAASGRVARLDASIAVLARRLGSIQADINAKSAELDKLRLGLSAARTRLGHLEAFESHAEQVLAQQLVGSYESAPPDIVTVVLSATGFQDLLNRLAFMQRVSNQDLNVVSQVRSARRAVAVQATGLGRLEIRQQTITQEVVAQRNQLAQTSTSLAAQRAAVARFRNAKAGAAPASARGRGRSSPASARAGRSCAGRVGGAISPGVVGLVPVAVDGAEGQLRPGIRQRLHVPAAQERRRAAERMVA